MTRFAAAILAVFMVMPPAFADDKDEKEKAKRRHPQTDNRGTNQRGQDRSNARQRDERQRNDRQREARPASDRHSGEARPAPQTRERDRSREVDRRPSNPAQRREDTTRERQPQRQPSREARPEQYRRPAQPNAQRHDNRDRRGNDSHAVPRPKNEYRDATQRHPRPSVDHFRESDRYPSERYRRYYYRSHGWTRSSYYYNSWQYGYFLGPYGGRYYGRYGYIWMGDRYAHFHHGYCGHRGWEGRVFITLYMGIMHPYWCDYHDSWCRHDYICYNGYWEYDSNGYTDYWISGYCDNPRHDHTDVFYDGY